MAIWLDQPVRLDRVSHCCVQDKKMNLRPKRFASFDETHTAHRIFLFGGSQCCVVFLRAPGGFFSLSVVVGSSSLVVGSSSVDSVRRILSNTTIWWLVVLPISHLCLQLLFAMNKWVCNLSERWFSISICLNLFPTAGPSALAMLAV